MLIEPKPHSEPPTSDLKPRCLTTILYSWNDLDPGGFLVCHVVSANTMATLDISDTISALGYTPLDNSEPSWQASSIEGT